MENSPPEAKPPPTTKEVLDDVIEVPKVKKDDKKEVRGLVDYHKPFLMRPIDESLRIEKKCNES